MTAIAAKFLTNPRTTWIGSEKIPLDVSGADGVGLASDLRKYINAGEVVETASADVTATLQTMLNDGVKSVFIPPDRSYAISGSLTVPANATVRIGGGGTLVATGMAATTPMFKNTLNSSLELYLDDLLITGQCTAAQLLLTGDQPNAGMIFRARNVRQIGSARAAGSCFLDARQLDFLALDNIRADAVDIAVRVRSDFSASERDNTQLNIKSFFADHCNIGAQWAGVDKAIIQNFDVYGCATGFLQEFANKRIAYQGCHVESMGTYAGNAVNGYDASYDGCGWFFAYDAQAGDPVTLDGCSAFPLASTAAVAGIYIKEGPSNPSDVTMRNCNIPGTASGSAGWKAIINNGRLRWEGPWEYTTGQTQYGDGSFANCATVIDPGPFGREAVVDIVAAATITLPLYGDIFTVSGATGITSVAASWPNRRVTLIFSSTPTVTDGSNLKMAGNLVASGDDTLSLICDGTNWYETGRSVN